MSLLPIAPLVSLFFFTSFALAGIYALDCTMADWAWVSMLSFHIAYFGSHDLMAFLSRCSILLGKMGV